VLEKNFEDLSKYKEGLEAELAEFKADLNVLVKNIQRVHKSLVPDSTSGAVDGELSVSKQAISQFGKLESDLDLVIKSPNNSDEAKSQELLNMVSRGRLLGVLYFYTL
jgi:hypothetical protein